MTTTVRAGVSPVGWQTLPVPRHAQETGASVPVGWSGLPDRSAHMVDELGLAGDASASSARTTDVVGPAVSSPVHDAAPSASTHEATPAAEQIDVTVQDEAEDDEPADEPGDAAPVNSARVRTVARSAPSVPRPAQTRVLTVANQKGGVGKTTTTVNLAAALAEAGLRVLVIDTDPQGNASTALGVDHRAEVPSVYEVLVDTTPMGDVVQESPDIPGLFCVPATIDLAGAEIELVSLVAREQRLARALRLFLAEHQGEDRFDYVFIDCPPSLGLLTVNAFVAAAEVLIPIQCEYYALEGLSQLLKNVEMIRAHLNPDLHVSTILMTMYDGRTRLSSQVAAEVREHFPALVLDATVPRSVRISEAPSHGQTVITYDPSSSGALSYVDAAVELTQQPA